MQHLLALDGSLAKPDQGHNISKILAISKKLGYTY